jgi:hypothetical protein
MAFQFVSVQQVSSEKLCFAAAIGPISVLLPAILTGVSWFYPVTNYWIVV